MRIYTREHNETLLDIVTLVLMELRRLPQPSEVEKIMLDTYTDIQQDLLGLRSVIEKNNKEV